MLFRSGIEGYSRDAFVEDLVAECEKDIRGSLEAGAHKVQIDFTEGRLACKFDPSGGLLRDFVALNNRVLDRFSVEDRSRIGVHTCPGGDMDSTHSADVDYAQLLPDLLRRLLILPAQVPAEQALETLERIGRASCRERVCSVV